ncbi:NAD-dependent epimerase/dehydratase family protein [Paenibacillus sp. TRM 82003]|nr:NAD-dependent epimerase/dehydratase family protein [Paenibacillus sp. TRM 82003]
MTNVLVTGATGFLGWHVATRLQTLGWQVTAQGRNEAMGRELERRGIRFFPAELSDRRRILDACAGQRYVFHCGALSSAWGKYKDFYDSNVLGTRHILEGCAASGTTERLIYISSPSVSFDYRDRFAVRESDPLPGRPANAYAATKRRAEEETLLAFETGRVRGIVMRPRAIFGPRDNALLPRLLRANAAGGVPLLRGGEAIVDFTYVGNVVDAMLAAVSAPEAALGRTYHLTNGEPMKLKDALATLFSKLGVPMRVKPLPYGIAYAAAAALELAYRLLPLPGEPVVTRYGVGVLACSQTLDIAEARERLGYAPAVSVEEGFERYAAWWKEQRR